MKALSPFTVLVHLHHQITILILSPQTPQEFHATFFFIEGVRECIPSQYCLNIAFDFDRSGLYKSMKSNNIQYLDTEIYKTLSLVFAAFVYLTDDDYNAL